MTSTPAVYHVSITRLRLRSWRYLLPFFFYAIRSSRQARRAPGCITLSLLREDGPGNIFWTRTVWQSADAMRDYMLSGAHRAAMPHLLNWCDEAAVAHWTQPTPDEPTWQQAYEQLIASGRASKVRHPSPNHATRRFPPPRTHQS